MEEVHSENVLPLTPVLESNEISINSNILDEPSCSKISFIEFITIYHIYHNHLHHMKFFYYLKSDRKFQIETVNFWKHRLSHHVHIEKN